MRTMIRIMAIMMIMCSCATKKLNKITESEIKKESIGFKEIKFCDSINITFEAESIEYHVKEKGEGEKVILYGVEISANKAKSEKVRIQEVETSESRNNEEIEQKKDSKKRPWVAVYVVVTIVSIMGIMYFVNSDFGKNGNRR